MKHLIKNSKIFAILVLAISFIGCEEDDAILPVVTAGFTHTISQETRTVTFINTSTNAHNYSWSFGDDTSSTEINPVKMYGIGAYTIVLEASNIAGASDTYEDTIIFLDADIPLITLIGDETINLTLDDAFTDPGATALDEVDGDLTANIIVGGDTVDTAVEGSYVITYDVTDAQGNEAVQVTRTVNVNAITCVAETEESLNTSDINITFLSDPAAAGSGVTVIEDNATYEYVDNPDFSTTANNSCKVGKVTKSGVQSWDNIQIDFADKITFTDDSNFTIKVFSPVSGYNVTFKLEDSADSNINTEVASTTTTTSTNAWEELTIPFGAGDSNKYDKLVIFFDLAGPANTNTYYFDDLKLNLGAGGGGGGTCVPETTESMSAASLNVTFMTDQTANITNDNATFEYVANPDFDNAVNSSCFVGKVTKSNVNPWDNNQIDLDAKLDFDNNSGIKIKVYSSVPGYTVLLKLEEQANPGINTEIDLTTTQTNAWEELTFPFPSSESNKYDRIVLIFDLATANTSTYYFDDLALYGTGGGGGGTYALTDTIDFEPAGFGAGWAWNVFENGGNPPLEFVANPNASGVNTSATVAKITALQAGQPYVGTETAHGEMGITWDLSASNAIIKIMVYKTVISDVGIKLVNPNGGAQEEIKVSNTVINQWEELTFDFTSRIGNGLDGSTNIDQIVVFPDFDLGGRTQDNIIYFDNITFN